MKSFSFIKYPLYTCIGTGICILVLGISGCSRGNQAPAATPTPTSTPTAAPEIASAASASLIDPAPPIGSPNLSKPFQEGLIPERLELPAIDLDTPVVELGWSTSQDLEGQVFSEWDVADNAAGWHKNSALFGDGGNMVLSGHNNIRGAVFRNLDRLKKGDEAILWADGHAIRYVVEQVLIVPEKYASEQQRLENAAWIGPFTDERLTLVSCWPRDDNSHRIIVVAHPLEDVGGSVG